MVNEFIGREFPCGNFIPADPAYANVSDANRICSTTGAQAGKDFVLGTDYVSTSFSYSHSHLLRNFGILIGFMVSLSSPPSPLSAAGTAININSLPRSSSARRT